MKKEKASNNGNSQPILTIQGKIMSSRKIAFRLIEKGNSRNVLWKTVTGRNKIPQGSADQNPPLGVIYS